LGNLSGWGNIASSGVPRTNAAGTKSNNYQITHLPNFLDYQITQLAVSDCQLPVRGYILPLTHFLTAFS